MPKLLSRQKSIPGGYKFYQPELNWEASKNVGAQPSFDTLVNAVITIRKSNPAALNKFGWATDYNSVSDEVDNFNATLCLKMGWLDYVEGGKASNPFYQRQSWNPFGRPTNVAGGGNQVIAKDSPFVRPYEAPRLSGAVGSAVATVKKLAAGAATLMEWNEAGMPHVDQQEAERRASICVKCPKNGKGKNLTDYFTVPVASLIKARLEMMKELKLSTPYDDRLFVCEACLCPMRTKVFFPPELVVKRLRPETVADLNQENPRCWIRDLIPPTE